MVLREKGCIRLNYPVTPGLKLGAENHLALRLREGKKKKKHGKKAIPCRASTEVSHKNNIMVCCVSSGQACLCHYTLTVCVNLSVWAAGVEANFKTNFIFVRACWSVAFPCVCLFVLYLYA